MLSDLVATEVSEGVVNLIVITLAANHGEVFSVALQVVELFGLVREWHCGFR